MNKIKIENWNGYSIRFVEKDNEWWAVANDVCEALAIKNPRDAIKRLRGVDKTDIPTSSAIQTVNIISEKDIYRLVFKSRKPEAEVFQDWVYAMLKELRQATGLEGFQIFRMLDKEHQKEAMRNLQRSIKQPTRETYIKANNIANKAVSTKYGYPKAIKKADMTPAMLLDREPILDDTVELMGVNDKYQLGLSVSEQIYLKCM